MGGWLQYADGMVNERRIQIIITILIDVKPASSLVTCRVERTV